MLWRNTGTFGFAIGSGDDEIKQPINLTTNLVTNETTSGGFGTKDDSVGANVKVLNTPKGTKEIGAWKENTLTQDGIKIYDPDEYGDNNKFVFGIPSDIGDNFKATVVVAGKEATTTTTGTQFTKPPSVTFLDTQIDTVKDRNIISVGGSAVNRVSAKILGLTYPTYGGDQAWQDATGVTGEGQALIKVFDSPYATGKVAMIVAGWTGVDTQRAGKAIYKRVPKLEGQEMLLSTVTETATKL